MTRSLWLLGAAALTLTPGPGAAQTPIPIDEVVVTATRLPTFVADAPGVRVIDEAEIEARQTTFAADLLEILPGVSMSRNGAYGGIAGVRIRGATTDQALVLLDGVPLNDPADPSGGYDFAHLDLDDVSRIELLSGPQGALWGSDAIGGVLSFTTRERDGWRAAVEGGSHGWLRGEAAIGETNARYAVGANVSVLSSGGVSKAASGTEADAYRAVTAGAYGRLSLAHGVTLDARVRYNDSRAEIDGYPPPAFAFGDSDDVSDSASVSGLARLRQEGFLGLSHELSLSAYDLDRVTEGESGTYPFQAERRVYRYVVGRGRPDDRVALLAGVERETTTANISTGAVHDLDHDAAFAVARMRPVDGLSLTGAVRFDDPDAYGSKITGRAAAAVDLGRGFILKASWGQGYKTPSISQLACDFCFPMVPPADLGPETAQGEDVQIAWRSADGRARLSATAFNLEVEDQIAYLFDAVTFNSTYVNLDRTRSRGIELDAAVELEGGVGLRAAYAYTDAEDAVTGAWLLRVPRHQGSASLLIDRDRWNGAVTVRAEGRQADNDPSTFTPTVRGGYVAVDVAAGYALRPGLEVTGRVENLFDADYQQILGYGEAGISAFVGLRLRSGG